MKGKKIDEETCQQIINLWMNYDYNQQKIADTLGVGYSTVRRTISEYTEDGSHTPPKGMLPPVEKPERRTQINEDFDNAVNQMIAEAKEPEPVTQKNMLHSTEIPDDVLTAVRDAIDYEDETVEDHLRTIRELQHEVEQRRTKAAIMRKWLEDCGYESTAD